MSLFRAFRSVNVCHTRSFTRETPTPVYRLISGQNHGKSVTSRLNISSKRFSGVYNVYTIRNIHSSSPRRAIHPLIWAALRPLLQGGIFIFGRYFRHRIWEWFKRNRRIVAGFSAGFVAWSGFYYYQHLETCPITNRRRFVMLNANHLVELGQLQAKALLTLYDNVILPKDDVRSQRVRRVARRLLDANSDLPQVKNTEWRVYVVDSNEANAFVLPSGDIFFLTGMLDTLANDDQLAIILAHELSHALLGHSLEMLSWARFLDWFLLGASGFVAVVVPGTWVYAVLTDAIVKKAVDIGLTLPYNRLLEYEADDVGLRLAAKGCFDTRESYAFWLALHMKKKITGESEIPSILSTHPDHGERAERLEALIEKSLDIRANCPCPPLKRYDPRLLANAKKRLIEEEMAMRGII